MRSTHSMVISMRLPAESGKRLKRMANRHGWTPSDASARLVEEGLRRSEFAIHRLSRFDCGPASLPSREHARRMGGHAARPQLQERCVGRGGTSRSWPEAKVQAAVNYAVAFPEEINAAMAENETTDFDTLKRMLPQATEFVRQEGGEKPKCSSFFSMSISHRT